MGIQDRDYYRNEGPSIFDSLVPSGLVCRWLISINIGIWVLQMIAQVNAQTGMIDGQISRGPGWVTEWFILDVDKILSGQVWRLLSHAFLHAVSMDDGGATFMTHILFNMLFLWWFGSDVEQLYGRKEFLAIYLTAAFLGGVAFVTWELCMPNRHGIYHKALGASGAISALLILCALHYPRRVIYVFAMVPMPIWMFAIFNVAKDTLTMFHDMIPGRSSGIGFQAHLAGAGFAVAYYKWQRSITETLRGWFWWKRSVRSRPRLKLFEPERDAKEPVAVTAMAPSLSSVDEHLEAKLDAILEKIAKTGKESLTDQEQEILKQASQMYKKRRT